MWRRRLDEPYPSLRNYILSILRILRAYGVHYYGVDYCGLLAALPADSVIPAGDGAGVRISAGVSHKFFFSLF